MSSNIPADLRYKKTLAFLQQHIPSDYRILDLGTPNLLSKEMQGLGYTVYNTSGEDFDTQYHSVIESHKVECYTSFEVFEHLMAPFNILREIPKGHLVCSVPLKVWFARAYWDQNNPWDRHYHEFEARQFDWLLEKSGWKIIQSERWASPDKLRFGLRPLLRFIFPSFYFVYAVKGVDPVSSLK
ncbi:MAG: methyltransferase domain-containing protein [Bacteroidales bacterium]